MRLADQYDGFLIDLDGVVWLGSDFIDGAVETLNVLAGEGKPVAFVTNSPRQSPAEHAETLRQGGVPVENDRVVTAGTTLVALALERFGPEPKVIATGTGSFLRQLTEAGIQLLEYSDWDRAEAVLISGHTGFDYSELKAASMAARAGALLAATGRDPTMPMPDGLWPGTGSILAAIETASGRRGMITGKPEAAIFEIGLEVIGATAGERGILHSNGEPMRVAMIGDRAETDVAGAQAVGLEGILVGDSSEPTVKPDHIIENLSGLLHPQP
ncbi:MAG: HAD-IIA family hydrolase [Solirubrobacterales bacterium]